MSCTEQINDSFGHDVGDNVLVNIADILRREVRANDILVRFGGEEFVIVFTNTSCQNGMTFAERIRQEISQALIIHEGETISLTVSIGLFCLDKNCQFDCLEKEPGKENRDAEVNKIIKLADTALYHAKAQGRDQVVRYCQDFLK